MSNKWVIEVARVRNFLNPALLSWEPAGKSATASSFDNASRKVADAIATEMAKVLGDTAVVRCRGTARNRGSFYPRPLPARLIVKG